MQNKLSAILALISSVSMIALGGCFYSSRAPAPYYYGGPAYSAPYAAPSYGWARPVNRRCNVRTGNCVVCNEHGHHCRIVPWG